MLSSYIVPHPPIARPSVGRGEEKHMQATLDGFRAVAGRIAEEKPETLIVISPHNVMFRDAFYIAAGDVYRDDLSHFGHPEEQVVHDYDRALIEEIVSLCEQADLPVCTDPRFAHARDHGTSVPLLFIDEAYSDYSIVRIAPSFLEQDQLLKMGRILERAIAHTGRKASIIASGDLSHKLKEDGPYGFIAEGPAFDRRLCEILGSGDLSALTAMDQALTDAAAQCGLPGFIILSGALENARIRPHVYSYEGPFGVGYAVCAFDVEDWCPFLAKKSLETFVKTGERLEVSDRSGICSVSFKDLPAWLLSDRAAVFVSLHKNGELRGCIGSLLPWKDCVADEILTLAIEAGTRDPRFTPVGAWELDDLTCSVDVLYPAEPADPDMLDPKKYGVIVTAGRRKGLLLPNLEGVDTADAQIAISLRKAGISPQEAYTLERFRVERHCR